MPATPQMVFIVFFVLVCAYTVKRGIAAIAKISIVIGILTIAAVILTAVLLIGNMDFSNFLPMLVKPAIKYVQATHIVAELPFLVIVALLMVVPMVKDNGKIKRYWILGILIAALLFFAITVRDTAVLGAASDILADNSFEAVRLINIGEFLTRIELLVALNYTAALYIKVSVLYYVTWSALSQLLRLEQNNSLILPLGSVAMVFAAVKVESAVMHTVWGARYATVFSFPCTVLFPLLMVFIAAIRKLKTEPPGAQMLQAQEPPKRKSKRREVSTPGQNAN
jgi:spore germination protein KB